MRKLGRVALLLLVTLTLHCRREIITREQYVGMDPAARTLVVRSMLGGEYAEDAKGARGSTYSKPVEHYRAELDRLYAAGEQRPVTEIWSELRDEKQ